MLSRPGKGIKCQILLILQGNGLESLKLSKGRRTADGMKRAGAAAAIIAGGSLSPWREPCEVVKSTHADV